MSLRTLKFGLSVVIAGLSSLPSISTVVFERQHALRRISCYNPTWQSSQTLHEFMRLQQCLLEFQASGGATDKDRIRFGMKSWWERGSSFRKGPSSPSWPAIRSLKNIRDVDRALAAEPLIADLGRPGPCRRRSRSFARSKASSGSSSAIYNDGAELTSEDEKELTRLHWTFSSLAGSLIFFGVLLIALLGRHNRLLGRAHQRMHSLAADSRTWPTMTR